MITFLIKIKKGADKQPKVRYNINIIDYILII